MTGFRRSSHQNHFDCEFQVFDIAGSNALDLNTLLQLLLDVFKEQLKIWCKYDTVYLPNMEVDS